MSDRHVALHPLDVVAFFGAIVLSIPIIALIDRSVPGPRDSPAMLFPYLCCGFLPCLLLTFKLVERLRGPIEVERRATTIGGRVEQKAQNCVSTALGLSMVVGLLFGLKAVAWVVNRTPGPSSAPPPAEQPGDPEARAKKLARRAIFARISSAGSETMMLDAKLITRDRRPWWRVTSYGAVVDYVVDVPPDSEEVAVFGYGKAPPPDAAGVAPVGS